VRPLRVASYVTLSVGVAALAGAGVVRLAAESDYTELMKNHAPQGKVDPNDAAGLEMLRRLEQKGNAITGLLIGSGAALATGTVLFFLSPSDAPPPVSVGVTAGPDGAGASLSGTF
jgi:hypothetical protein